MKIVFTVLALFVTAISFAQSIQAIEKDDFKLGEIGFREAWDQVKEAQFYLEEGTKEGAQFAIELYQKATRYNDNCAPLNYNIALAYGMTKEFDKAIGYLEKAYDKNPNLTDSFLFELAVAQHMNSLYAKALANYKTYLSQLPAKLIPEQEPIVKKKIQECENGLATEHSQARVVVENLGANINTRYKEHSPVVSADNAVLYFTSRRPIGDNDKRDRDGGFFENIYQSEIKDGVWQPATLVAGDLNTKEHDATIGLSPNGQKMYVYRSKGNGNIYETKLTGDHWEKAEEVRGSINTSKQESSACISYDGKELFFVSASDFEGQIGGRDIYVSQLNEKGKWGEPKNLGSTINTSFDEEHVFIMPDGRTLYFSSQGHNSVGGFDIFRTQRQDDGTWTTPENIGPPVNTPGDDIFYAASANGINAYYSSAAQGGFGSTDIYKIVYLSPENPLPMEGEDNLIASLSLPIKETESVTLIPLRTIRLTILKGIIRDSLTMQPLEANIEIIDNEKNELVFTSTSNSATGKYLVSLPSGKNYGIAVHQEGYLFHSENFDIAPAQDYTEVEKNIALLSIKVGSKVILKNIFFDVAKWDLRPTSKPEIARIFEFMNRYSSVQIQINGHTDNVGKDNDNLILSQNRAKSVMDELIRLGISASRISSKGFGETTPIATNETTEGRQENRRVEFEIMAQ